MGDFLLLSEIENQDNITQKIKNMFSIALKGYSVQTELSFLLGNHENVRGTLVTSKKPDFNKLSKIFSTSCIGIEGSRGWEYLANSKPIAGNFILTPGINLNLAVAIHNIKSIIASKGNDLPFKSVALYNFNSSNGTILARILCALLRNVTLIGEDKEKLQELTKELFNEYGVMVSTAPVTFKSKNVLHIDASSIYNYVGKMNFTGTYQIIKGKWQRDFLFSASLIETLLLAGGYIDRNKYDPFIISLENISAIAKAAKRANFLPVFTTVQNGNLEHNNVTPSKAAILP